MKFFTMQWWGGCRSGNGGDVIDRFHKHIDSIRHQLPADLLALQESISLHDSTLLSLNVSCAEKTASIKFRLANGEPMELLYSGVKAFESAQSHEIAVGGPGGYGDLGYDEPDVLPDGLFEHRVLFSSSIELRLRFRSMKLVR